MSSLFGMAVAAASAFNLVCSGTLETTSVALREKKNEPYIATYRIDLAKNQYCEADCRAIREIDTVQPAFIILHQRQVDSPSEKSRTTNTIDRVTGEHTISSFSETRGRFGDMMSLYWHGKCERQPFTGFPSFDTKF